MQAGRTFIDEYTCLVDHAAIITGKTISSTLTLSSARMHAKLWLTEQLSHLQDLSSSSAEDLTAGLKTLQQHSSALQNEIGHCDRVLSILQQLASQQVGPS